MRDLLFESFLVRTKLRVRTGVVTRRFLRMRIDVRGRLRSNASGLSRHAAPRLWRNRGRKVAVASGGEESDYTVSEDRPRRVILKA